MEDKQRQQQPAINPTVALALWQRGLSSGQIAARFPGTTCHNARYAAIKGAKLAGIQLRQGRYKPAPAAPPLAALWS